MSQLETVIKRWPSLTFWAVFYFIGGVVGALSMAWIIATDSHTGESMGNLGLAMLLVLLALISVVIGAVMIPFRVTRVWGAILLAGGAGTITTAIIGFFNA